MTLAPKRRWFFSLRTLFVVVTVVDAVLGWVIYELNWIRQRHALLADFPRWSAYPVGGKPSAPGLLWLFGEHGRSIVTLVVLVDDPSLPIDTKADIQRAKRLFPEARVEYAVIPTSAGSVLEEVP